MAVQVQVGMDEVMQHFEALEDPRSSVNLHHPLPSVVVISVMAVLAGANGPTAIAKWANLKADYLMKILPLPNGIPQKDVYWRVANALTARIAASGSVPAGSSASAVAPAIERPPSMSQLASRQLSSRTQADVAGLDRTDRQDRCHDEEDAPGLRQQPRQTGHDQDAVHARGVEFVSCSH
jgi:hypothetical protein